jgi:hypothetical protein
MTTLTLTGKVAKIEKAGKWVAFVIAGRTTCKVIMKDAPAKEALESIKVGSEIVATSSKFACEGHTVKLWTDLCMFLPD